MTSDTDRTRFGLSAPAAARDAKRVVVLVHGFNSSPEATAPMLVPARRLGIACGTFRYPNDQSLADSATLLARELRRQKRERPERVFALVTHSMGGLVARAVVEDPRLDQGNVERLVMVAPPNHGSILAHYAVGTDLWEHWLKRRSGSPWRRYRDGVVDGMGEAATDLCPGSSFLRRLNSRQRNPRVRYTIVAGTGGAVERGHIDWLRRQAAGALRRMRARGKAEAVDRVLEELAETLGRGGDGVVAVRRARLAGVADTVLLPFDHTGVACWGGAGANRDARELLADRLAGFTDASAASRKLPN